jgi:sarcosine oxidase subunit beta
MSKRCVVIGAGIIGAATGLELRRRGYDVVVLERAPSAGVGSTALSSSVIRCHYTRSDAIAVALEGRHVWQNWADYTGLKAPRAKYHPVGVLFLLNTGRSGSGVEGLGVKAEMDEHDLAHRFEMMDTLGVGVEQLTVDDLRSRFPTMTFPEENVVGLFEPQSGYVAYPTDAVMDLQDAGERAGVEYRFGVDVYGAETRWDETGRVIEAIWCQTAEGRQRVDCDVVVNCAGPDSHDLNIAVGCPLPLSTVPLRQFIIEGEWKGHGGQPIPAMADLAGGFYLRPDRDVFKVGAVLPEDHVGFLRSSTDGAEPGEVEAFQDEFLERMRLRVPTIELSNVQTRVAAYDWTVADSYPLVGGTDVGGYYVSIGTSGAWFKSGPVLGSMIAEIIARDLAGDHDPRMRLTYSGNAIDIGAFAVCLERFSD